MSIGYQERGLESTERNLPKYLERLNLKPEDLRDKKILDVGSGVGRFAAEAKDFGVEDVVSLDPGLKLKRNREKSKKIGAGAAMAARADALPFRDGSFDLVLNSFSVPMWSESPGEMEETFREELRTLRPGGEIRIAPVMIIGEIITAYFTPEDEHYEELVSSWDKMLDEWRSDPTLRVRLIQSPDGMKNTLVIKKIKMDDEENKI
jgi:ubiquinone/menaquinone biosynthesis C-methylase UbiE